MEVEAEGANSEGEREWEKNRGRGCHAVAFTFVYFSLKACCFAPRYLSLRLSLYRATPLERGANAVIKRAALHESQQNKRK